MIKAKYVKNLKNIIGIIAVLSGTCIIFILNRTLLKDVAWYISTGLDFIISMLIYVGLMSWIKRSGKYTDKLTNE